MTTAGRPPRMITILNHSPRGNNPKVKHRNNTIRPHQMSWNGLNIFYVNLLDMLVNLFEIRSEFSYFLRSKCDTVASAYFSSFAVGLGNISTICFESMLIMIVNRHLLINEFITWFPFECVWTCQREECGISSHYTLPLSMDVWIVCTLCSPTIRHVNTHLMLYYDITQFTSKIWLTTWMSNLSRLNNEWQTIIYVPQ